MYHPLLPSASEQRERLTNGTIEARWWFNGTAKHT
jgi:hypothetical protein